MPGIGLTDYIKPKNDAFTGMVQASQVLGGGGDGTLPDACVAASNVTQHEAAIDHDSLTNFAANEHFTEASIDHAAITNIGTNTHAQIDSHLADSGNPHGSIMSVSVMLKTPRVRATNEDLYLEAFNTSADQTVYVYNSDGIYEADLDVERDIIVGGKVLTFKIESTGNLFLDTDDSFANSTVFVRNLDATYDANLNVDGNIIVGGTVDGRDVAADGTVLDTALTAAAVITDHALVRGAGGGRGTQDSLAILTDSGDLSGLTGLTAGNLRLTTTISSTTGNVKLGDALDCNGHTIIDETRDYVQIADGLWVTETAAIGQSPVSFAALVANPTGANVYIGIFGGVTYTGPVGNAFGLSFVVAHDKTNPSSHQFVYGVNTSATNAGVAVASRNIKSWGAYVQATNSGAQLWATVGAYAYGLYIDASEPGTGGNAAGNFYGYGLFVEDTTPPSGSPTSNQEWCALFEGDVQINSDKQLILEGSATSKGDTYLVYDSAGVTVDFFLSGTEEMNIGVGVVNILNELDLDGDLNHDGSNIGFFGTAPAAQAAAYTPSNVIADRAYDADATSVAELADVLGTLIADLQSYGLLQ